MSWAEDDYIPIPDASHSHAIDGSPTDRESGEDRDGCWGGSCCGDDALRHLSFDSFLLLQAKALRMFSYGK
jgi:hypothetical protein